MMRISGLHIAAAGAFIILVGLGTWQLQRRAEKLDLIARHEQALNGPAEQFPPDRLWESTDFSKLE
ncbi:MAG: SURF1 family cytochrome oxidase biogenesis protein, partial [Pseudomonadota bacterium]